MKKLNLLTGVVLLCVSLHSLAGGSENAVASSERELGKIWQSKQIKSRVTNREILRINQSVKSLDKSLAVFIEKIGSSSEVSRLSQKDVDVLLKDVDALADYISSENFRRSAPDVAENGLEILSATKKNAVMALHQQSGVLTGKSSEANSGVGGDLVEQLMRIRKFRKNLEALVN